MSVVRQLDLLLLALSLPIFLVAGLPMAGWGVGAGAWLVQRGVQEFTNRRARATEDPRTMVGLLAGSMIARGWLVAIAIFLVGLSDSHSGLAAAVLVVALFTVYFTVGIITRPFEQQAPRRAGAGTSGAPPLASDGGTR